MAVQADILLDASGDLPLQPILTSGPRLIAQRIRLRLIRWRGEDLLNASLGLPWLDWLQARPQPIAQMGALIRREIEAVPGVLEVRDFAISGPTAPARRITVSCRVVVSPDVEITVQMQPLERDADGNVSVLVRMPDFAAVAAL